MRNANAIRPSALADAARGAPTGSARRRRRTTTARLSVLGAVACCGVVLWAAGPPLTMRSGSAPTRNGLALPTSAAAPVSVDSTSHSGPAGDLPSPTRSRVSTSLPAGPSRTSGTRSATGARSTPFTRSSSARTPGTAPPHSPAALEPGPGNTGVPAGTVLRRYDGNLVITQPGTTYDALDIHGFVFVMAPNVTIKRSIIRGGAVTRDRSAALVSDMSDRATNFVLEDSELAPDRSSMALDGVRGWNFSLVRVNAYGTADAAAVFGDNVSVKRSWLHGFASYTRDRYRHDRSTQSRAIRIFGTHRVVLSDNTIED